MSARVLRLVREVCTSYLDAENVLQLDDSGFRVRRTRPLPPDLDNMTETEWGQRTFYIVRQYSRLQGVCASLF